MFFLLENNTTDNRMMDKGGIRLSQVSQRGDNKRWEVQGRVRCDKVTKRLVRRLLPGEIAVIQHADLDELAADSLIEARVAAVINTAPSMSGRYPNRGPLRLLQAGVPLIDVKEQFLKHMAEGDWLLLRNGEIYKQARFLTAGILWTRDKVLRRMHEAERNGTLALRHFIDNTLCYARQEKHVFLEWIPPLSLCTPLRGRHALIVARGRNYRADLHALIPYICANRPVLIGVDGGADALLQIGLCPDVIVGDMDSVSDEALRKAKERVVHAYLDGYAPGLTRMQQLGLSALVIPAPGTSEDVAMLLADGHGAELIVAVGTHSYMIDFLEKGRNGMASTLLTRLRLGGKLVDAKGVSQIYSCCCGNAVHGQKDMMLHAFMPEMPLRRRDRHGCQCANPRLQ